MPARADNDDGEQRQSPPGVPVALLNRLLLRREFRTVVDALLAGLRTTAEQRHNITTDEHP